MIERNLTTLPTPANGQQAGPPIRCLHVVENVDLEKGGVARALVDLVTALQRNGVITTVASPDLDAARSVIPAFPVGPMLHSLSRNRASHGEMIGLINDHDIVHLHTPWWLMNPSLVQAARRRGKPVILSIHGMLDDWSLRQKALKKWGYLRLVARRMIRQCVIHCTAEDERRQVLKRVHPIAAEVLPLIIDNHFFDLQLDPALAEARWPYLSETPLKKLLFLSRIHPKKSLEIAIHALPSLQDCMLTVAGPGDPKYVNSLKQLADRLGIASRIQWLGSVHGAEKYSLLASCDCMLLPTQQENFGLVQVEGLAMGLHVITTFGTDNWKELRNCGAMVVERTPQAFIGAVNRCDVSRSNRQLRLNFQRARLLEWLAPDPTAQRYIEMYRKYIHSNQRRID